MIGFGPDGEGPVVAGMLSRTVIAAGVARHGGTAATTACRLEYEGSWAEMLSGDNTNLGVTSFDPKYGMQQALHVDVVMAMDDDTCKIKDLFSRFLLFRTH